MSDENVDAELEQYVKAVRDYGEDAYGDTPSSPTDEADPGSEGTDEPHRVG
jgi:hypothetical protein